jgi:hypothetical protein
LPLSGREDSTQSGCRNEELERLDALSCKCHSNREFTAPALHSSLLVQAFRNLSNSLFFFICESVLYTVQRLLFNEVCDCGSLLEDCLIVDLEILHHRNGVLREVLRQLLLGRLAPTIRKQTKRTSAR